MLEQDRGRIEPVFPVASGRLEPTMVPELTKIFGKDVIMQFGGGIHAHPMGTVSGAMACMHACMQLMHHLMAYHLRNMQRPILN